MIYLIQSGDLYKIGYSNNVEHRFNQYKQHNPTAILLDSKEGSYKDEKALHRLCEKYKIDQPEWFNSDKVIEIFKNYIPIQESENLEVSESKENYFPNYDGEWVYKYTFCDNFKDIYYISSPIEDFEIKCICLTLSSFLEQYNLDNIIILPKSLLQKLLGVKSKNTIIKREKALEDLGLVKIERYIGDNNFNSSINSRFYTLLIDNYKNTRLNELIGIEKYTGTANVKFGDYYLYPYWNGVKYIKPNISQNDKETKI